MCTSALAYIHVGSSAFLTDIQTDKLMQLLLILSQSLQQTLDLLFKMTNPANVTVITDKLINYLTNTKDEFMKADLVSKITQLAERYPPLTFLHM